MVLEEGSGGKFRRVIILSFFERGKGREKFGVFYLRVFYFR